MNLGTRDEELAEEGITGLRFRNQERVIGPWFSNQGKDNWATVWEQGEAELGPGSQTGLGTAGDVTIRKQQYVQTDEAAD